MRNEDRQEITWTFECPIAPHLGSVLNRTIQIPRLRSGQAPNRSACSFAQSGVTQYGAHLDPNLSSLFLADPLPKRSFKKKTRTGVVRVRACRGLKASPTYRSHHRIRGSHGDLAPMWEIFSKMVTATITGNPAPAARPMVCRQNKSGSHILPCEVWRFLHNAYGPVQRIDRGKIIPISP